MISNFQPNLLQVRVRRNQTVPHLPRAIVTEIATGERQCRLIYVGHPILVPPNDELRILHNINNNRVTIKFILRHRRLHKIKNPGRELKMEHTLILYLELVSIRL